MDPWITCKACSRKGRLSTFQNTCDNEDCKIIMARRKNKNQKPAAIMAPNRHPANCVCARCLEDDADKVEAALLKASGNGPRQVPLRIRETESEVVSEYDKDEEALYVEVAPAICINIYPKGKK